MNPERLQLKGMLAESKKQYGELRTQASGYVLIIRSLLNPYEDVSKLDTEKALSSMKLVLLYAITLRCFLCEILDICKFL